MTFPFEVLETSAREAGLVIAVLIGVAFGFVLERAGFGRSTKLAAQFYLRDMTVFKVMFSAIVTAMLGLVIASSLGLADLRTISESIASWTYIWPMLAGGLLLGAGFIISGYCPGTSIVAASSGNIDGVVAFSGVVAGTFVYSELLQIPRFATFHESGGREAWFLYDILPLAPEILAAAIAVMAIVAFIGAEKVEALVARKSASAPAVARDPRRRLAFATIGAGAAAALIALAVPQPAPAAAGQTMTIDAATASRMLVEEPWTVRIVDARPEGAALAGSEKIDARDIPAIPDDGRTVVVIGSVTRPLPRHIRLLNGGTASWQRDPLARAVASGVAPVTSSSAPVARTPFSKPKKKGGGCSA